LNSRDKFRNGRKGWAKAFSDGRITKPEYIDAGISINRIARFHRWLAETTDHSMSNEVDADAKMSLPFLRDLQLDKIRAEEQRYQGWRSTRIIDTLLTQLGHIPVAAGSPR